MLLTPLSTLRLSSHVATLGLIRYLGEDERHSKCTRKNLLLFKAPAGARGALALVRRRGVDSVSGRSVNNQGEQQQLGAQLVRECVLL